MISVTQLIFFILILFLIFGDTKNLILKIKKVLNNEEKESKKKKKE
jgi:hypothetical protein